MGLNLNGIVQHYEFRLKIKKKDRVRILKGIWLRGPQEALEWAQEFLGIKGRINPKMFRRKGGVALEKVVMKDEKLRGEVIYPF